MKNYFLAGLLVFSFACVFAQTSADEKEVLKINDAFDEAIKNGDVAFYERLLAPDYVSYGPDGSMKNRSQVLEEVKQQKTSPAYRFSKLGSDDEKVKVSGDLAVVTAKWNATTQSIEDDESHDDTGHYLSVYEKRDGRWQLISEMESEKPHTPEELEPALKEASNKYDEAIKKGDSIAFKKLLAEDYLSTNAQGEIHSREQDIAFMFDPDLKMENISTEDKKFRVYRNFAVETGQYNVNGTYKGEEFTESGRYTSTWRYKDGKWKMVADHTSDIQPEK